MFIFRIKEVDFSLMPYIILQSLIVGNYTMTHNIMAIQINCNCF